MKPLAGRAPKVPHYTVVPRQPNSPLAVLASLDGVVLGAHVVAEVEVGAEQVLVGGVGLQPADRSSCRRAGRGSMSTSRPFGCSTSFLVTRTVSKHEDACGCLNDCA